MAGKQVTELDTLPSFTDTSLLPVHNGAGLKKGSLTQLADYLGNKFSNPNLLINPDFKINQRRASSYEKQGYSVDRWKIWNVTVTPSASGGITVKNDKYTDTGTFIQTLENATEGDSTLSCYVTSVSGTVTMVADDDSQVILKQGLNVVHTSKSTKTFTIFLNRGTSITLKWVKLEQGKVATEFIAPNPAEELIKCCRFYQKLQVMYTTYGVADQHYYHKLPLITALRINPTVNIEDQYNFNVKTKKIEWRSDGTGWLNLDVVAQSDAQTVCQLICSCDAEIY
ncbi:hypothetical protein [Holdemanella sp.]|uniref:hypothetical protein n=1 Tax=Holdemanella sp. TaxID=1971762 RepID=UPI00307B8CB6